MHQLAVLAGTSTVRLKFFFTFMVFVESDK